jgi:hypothetical protein
MTHPYTRLFTLPAPPDADNDVTEGYEAGDVVHVTGGSVYDCRDASTGTAVWEERSGGSFDGNVTEQLKLSGFENISLISDEDDWALTNFATRTVYRITLSGNCEISGIAGGAEGKIVVLVSLVSNVDQIALMNESTNSLAANRFSFGQNIGLLSGQSIILIYDGTASRWRRLNSEKTFAEVQTIVTFTVNDEYVQDKVGAMVSSNTETGIAVTYDDTAGKLNFDAQTAGDARYALLAKGVTNGDTHNHVGGDGAVLYHTDAIGTFLASVTILASTTYYSCPYKPTADTVTNSFPWPEGGVLSDMTLRTSTAQPASGSLVATLFVNGSATALVVTVAAGAAAGSYTDSTHTVNLSANDTLRWNIVNNATAASAALTGVSMKLTKPTT